MKFVIFCLSILSLLFVTGCQPQEVDKKEPRLDYYIESYEIPGVGFTAQSRVDYEYEPTTERLAKYRVANFNATTSLPEEQRYFLFSYNGDNVASLQGFLPGATSPYVVYTYDYLANGSVAKITEVYSSGTSSQANFVYEQNGSVQVVYSFSNGPSIQYTFVLAAGNIGTDQTNRGSQVCSNGRYTYDTQKNPFNTLGYVDYFLTTISKNNRLTENVDYLGCAFPTFIPESYTYQYNSEGYPTVATTFYKTDGGIAKSKKELFYTTE